MFFKLIHAENSASLLRGTFSSDGQMFFLASDVARLLRYKSHQQFARKNSKSMLKDVIYKRSGLPISVSKTRLFALEETLEFLEGHKRSDWISSSFAECLARANETFTYSLPDDWTPTSWNLKDAVPLLANPKFEEVREGDVAPSLKRVLEEVKLKTLEFYDRLADENETLRERISEARKARRIERVSNENNHKNNHNNDDNNNNNNNNNSPPPAFIHVFWNGEMIRYDKTV